jgi:hypothetical protein
VRRRLPVVKPCRVGREQRLRRRLHVHAPRHGTHLTRPLEDAGTEVVRHVDPIFRRRGGGVEQQRARVPLVQQRRGGERAARAARLDAFPELGFGERGHAGELARERRGLLDVGRDRAARGDVGGVVGLAFGARRGDLEQHGPVVTLAHLQLRRGLGAAGLARGLRRLLGFGRVLAVLAVRVVAVLVHLAGVQRQVRRGIQPLAPQPLLQARVPVVLNLVVRAPWQLRRNSRPSAPKPTQKENLRTLEFLTRTRLRRSTTRYMYVLTTKLTSPVAQSGVQLEDEILLVLGEDAALEVGPQVIRPAKPATLPAPQQPCHTHEQVSANGLNPGRSFPTMRDQGGAGATGTCELGDGAPAANAVGGDVGDELAILVGRPWPALEPHFLTAWFSPHARPRTYASLAILLPCDLREPSRVPSW